MCSILLSACGSSENSRLKEHENKLFSGGNADYYNAIVDTETGCQYIESYEYRTGGLGIGITPRLDEKGMPMCDNN